jgi:hypothetical protein
MAQAKSWPTGRVAMLVRAALCPPTEASRAWQDWKAARNFDDITWDEMRLLVPVAARLAELDPASPLRPRIDGLAKQIWTRTQIGLRESCQAFDGLNQAGVPFIVFKGGAQYAEGLAVSPRRVMGDIDVLIQKRDVAPALTALEASGWLPVGGESFAFLRQVLPARLRGNFRKGQYGEIDLHVSPFHFARSTADLEGEMWARARPASLALRPVLVPDPTDSMLLLLAHGAEGGGGSWAIDAATRMDRQPIDWDRLVATAERRGIVPGTREGIAYLREGIGLPVPEHVPDRLDQARASVAERLKHWSNVRHPGDRGRVENLADGFADRILRRQGFDLVVKDARLIRAMRAPGVWMNRRRGHDETPSEAALDHHRSLHDAADHAALFFRLRMDPPETPRRFLFEVSVDGVVIARLRARLGGAGDGKPVDRLFRLPLPKGKRDSLDITISARSLQLVRSRATAAEIARFAAAPFRIVGLWTA